MSFNLSDKMFKKYFLRLFSVLILVTSITAGVSVKPEPMLAFSTNPNDYFTYSYTFAFYKADEQTPLDFVNAGDTFYVRVNGTATCIQDLPGSIDGVDLTGSVVAQPQQGGTQIVLNSNFTYSYPALSMNKGDSVSKSVDIKLIFPSGSASGTYNIVGKISEAKAHVHVVFPLTLDLLALGVLPSSQTMGTVGYGVSVPVVVSGGGGGGGGGAMPPEEPQPITKLTDATGSDGKLNKDVEAKSLDGLAVLDLPVGVKIIDGWGRVATGIIMDEVKKEDEPQPPKDSYTIGKAYNFGGNGLTFDQPVKLTFHFDPTLFPQGVQKKDLYIAWWDVNNKQWVALTDCTVDETANTVTAKISHFTIFALIAKPSLPTSTTTQAIIIPPVSTTPTLNSPIASTPASTTATAIPINNSSSTTSIPAQVETAGFTVSNVSVSSGEVEVGSDITINALVTNSGDTEAEQDIALKLNNSTVETKQVTLAAKTSESLSFTIKASTAGTQTITIGTQSLQLNVKEPAQTAQPVNTKKIYGYLIGAMIGIGIGLVALGLIFVLMKPWRKT